MAGDCTCIHTHAWRCFVQDGVEQLNQCLEQEEVKRKDELNTPRARRVDRRRCRGLEVLRSWGGSGPLSQ